MACSATFTVRPGMAAKGPATDIPDPRPIHARPTKATNSRRCDARAARRSTSRPPGAEYVLRWLPRGTHDWRRFVRPSELARHIRDNGARVAEVTGVGYDIMTDTWRLVGDVSVNYMVAAEKSN